MFPNAVANLVANLVANFLYFILRVSANWEIREQIGAEALRMIASREPIL